MPVEHKFEQQGQNITGPQTNIAGVVQGPVLSGRFEVIKSIITTGNNSPVFVGDYERLRDAVIQPKEVFRRVHIESFVGRSWLIGEIDSILNDDNNNCGYLVLEAHVGLGKTAFLAWLVKERNYIHHFVELAPGQDGIEMGLKNLAAQIILAYKLRADEAIPDAARRPDYLYHLLSQAAEMRAPGERIVVVVDALDEAGTPSRQNVLGLPKVLPEGVFFIVSMRPVQVTLLFDRSTTPRLPLKILAESDENLEDIKIFLKASAGRPKVKRALEESRYTVDRFVDALVKKSQGLWIYLHFVIPEIERGERSPLDLEKLPEGLQEYYAGYWARWRKKEKWYDLYLPILTTLAAEQEPCTLDRILNWARIEANEGERRRLRNILNEEWCPFLAIPNDGMGEKYRFYHATVREFFEGKAEQDRALAVESYLLNELSLATKEKHRFIAECYLASWGGLEKGLPNLMDEKDIDNGYGLRHLAAHLESSGQDDGLHYLFKLEIRQGRNLWYEVKGATGDTTGYINDIMKAWRLADKGYDPEDIKKTGKFIGIQSRYALIFASINSLSGNIPSELLLALVENGIWSKEEGLAHARHVPDRSKRVRILAELSSLLKEPKLLEEALLTALEIQNEEDHAQALIAIAPLFNDAQNIKVLDEYLAIIRKIRDGWQRAQALAAIAPLLHDPHEALAIIREIQDDWQHALPLAAIASQLQDPQKKEVLDKALAIARVIQYEEDRVQALAAIAPQLQDAQKKEVLDEALTAAREIQDDWSLAQALSAIASQLEGAQKREVLDEALTAAREIQDEEDRVQALTAIAPQLPDVQKIKVLDEALTAAREIQHKVYRAQALSAIAPQLPDAQKIKVLDEALAAARKIQDDWSLAQALAVIIPQFQDVHKALATIRKIQHEVYRAQALAAIAPQLQDLQEREILDEAQAIAREIKDNWSRAQALAAIAPRPHDPHKALATTREIKWERDRAQALSAIAPRLQDAKKIGILDEALAIAREIKDNWSRVQALSAIAPQLLDAQKIEILDEALAIAREIKDNWSRAQALSAIAPQLLDVQKIKVLDEALAAFREIQHKVYRAQALAAIAPQLPDAQKIKVLDEALAAAREIQDDWSLAQALAAIAPQLPDVHEALAAARGIQHEVYRAQALAAIAPQLPDAQKIKVLDEALAIAREIQNRRDRAQALEGIVLSMLAHECLIYSSLLPPTIHSLSIRGRDDLLSDLSSLAPLISRLGGDDALMETIEAIKDVGRWWP